MRSGAVVVFFFTLLTALAGAARAQEVGDTLPTDDEEATPEPEGPAAPVEAAPVRTSGARIHDGFFFRGGLNVGLLMLTADASREIEYSGLQGGLDLLFGGTLMPGLVVGGALITGRTNRPGVDDGVTSRDLEGSLLFAGAAAFGSYYLDPREGLHLQGLAGFAGLDFVSASGASSGNDPTGIFFGFGAGYDFWIADEWSVGPFARILYSMLSTKTDVTYRYFYPSIGAAITYH